MQVEFFFVLQVKIFFQVQAAKGLFAPAVAAAAAPPPLPPPPPLERGPRIPSPVTSNSALPGGSDGDLTSSATRLWREEEDEEVEVEEEEVDDGHDEAHDSISRVVGTWPHESPSAGTSTDGGGDDAAGGWCRPARCRDAPRSAGATGRVVTWLVSSTARPRSLASEDSEAAREARARAREAA